MYETEIVAEDTTPVPLKEEPVENTNEATKEITMTESLFKQQLKHLHSAQLTEGSITKAFKSYKEQEPEKQKDPPGEPVVTPEEKQPHAESNVD